MFTNAIYYCLPKRIDLFQWHRKCSSLLKCCIVTLFVLTQLKYHWKYSRIVQSKESGCMNSKCIQCDETAQCCSPSLKHMYSTHTIAKTRAYEIKSTQNNLCSTETRIVGMCMYCEWKFFAMNIFRSKYNKETIF